MQPLTFTFWLSKIVLHPLKENPIFFFPRIPQPCSQKKKSLYNRVDFPFSPSLCSTSSRTDVWYYYGRVFSELSWVQWAGARDTVLSVSGERGLKHATPKGISPTRAFNLSQDILTISSSFLRGSLSLCVAQSQGGQKHEIKLCSCFLTAFLSKPRWYFQFVRLVGISLRNVAILTWFSKRESDFLASWLSCFSGRVALFFLGAGQRKTKSPKDRRGKGASLSQLEIGKLSSYQCWRGNGLLWEGRTFLFRVRRRLGRKKVLPEKRLFSSRLRPEQKICGKIKAAALLFWAALSCVKTIKKNRRRRPQNDKFDLMKRPHTKTVNEFNQAKNNEVALSKQKEGKFDPNLDKHEFFGLVWPDCQKKSATES